MLWKILIGFNCVGGVVLCAINGGEGMGLLPIWFGFMAILYCTRKKPSQQPERNIPKASYNSRQLDEYTEEFGLIEMWDKD